MDTNRQVRGFKAARDGEPSPALICLIGAAVAVLCCLYLIFGSYFFADTRHLDFFDPSVATFAGTVSFSVCIGVLGFLSWLLAYRQIVRPVLACQTCQQDLSEVPCPECGKVRKRASGHSNEVPMKRDRMGQGRLPVGRWRFIRFIGACILSVSVFYLILGGVVHLLYVPILRVIPYFIDDAMSQWELSVVVFDFLNYFPGSVPLVVLVGLFGFFVWFIPYRSLARAVWLCPSCHYDLSGIPCPKCDVTGSVEQKT